MDTLDQINVIKENNLKEIKGGASLSGTVVNYFTKALSTILDIGRNLGSNIRRFVYKNKCSL